MAPNFRFGVLFSFRNPPTTGLSTPDLYERTLQQIERVEALGFDHVWITEHHFVEDGYMSSPLVISAAIAQRTKRVLIGQDVMLAPFANPVRLAEDLAVLDNLSRGRIMLGAGMGYVPSEFAGMGVPRKERRARMDDAMEILKRAWTEEEFDFAGESLKVEKVRVRPRPFTPGGPPLWVAAMSEAGARRAARFGANLLPQGDRAAVVDPWREGLGAKAQEMRAGVVRHFIVTDAAAAPPNVASSAIARIAAGGAAETEGLKVYEDWFREVPKNDRMMTQLVEGDAAGRLVPQDAFFGDAAACVAEVKRMRADFGITDIILAGGGDGPSTAAPDKLLERFAKEVIPHFR